MDRLVTLAVFDNIFDVRYNLLKDMLDQAGIGYVTTNEKLRTVKPAIFMIPANVAIGIKVDAEKLDEAMEILNSIS